MVMLDRRRSLILLGAASAALAPGLSACSEGAVAMFPDLAAALRAVEGLGANSRSTGAWTLSQILNHAAQSVEYSLTGFPQPKSALFQATLGKTALAVFQARGRMSHSLQDPIPGAPALAATDPLPAAVARLAKVLRDFDAHNGPLQPHFAYGALDKAQYTRAHLMHLANHWAEIESKES